jgi:hypothetical protein
MNGIIAKGTIVVATRTQQTACGIKYIKQNSILEVAEDCPAWNDTVKVYRNSSEKADDNTHIIYKDKLRMADEEEVWAYESGVYYADLVEY